MSNYDFLNAPPSPIRISLRSEGTSWLQVATGVRTISACHKELWCVLEHASPSLFGLIPAALQQAAAGAAAAATGGILASGPSATARGILAKRSGITPDSPAGIGWDVAIGVKESEISIPPASVVERIHLSGWLERHFHQGQGGSSLSTFVYTTTT